MQRIHTTFDLLEAHIVTGLLRENGAEVWACDVDIVRQDWFKMIAFGGFRLLASDASIADALVTLHQYQNGELALPDDHADACPKCGEFCVAHDPQPRRNVFLAMILLSLVESAAFLSLQTLTSIEIIAAFALQFILYLSLPWLVIAYFKWRMRCTACGYRWRESPQRYADLRNCVATAEET